MIKFPLMDSVESQQFPDEPHCLICSKAVGEEKGFVRLTAGGLDQEAPGVLGKLFTPEYTALLSIWCHGPNELSHIPARQSELEFQLVDCHHSKQVDLVFCSTTCLSSFFTAVVSQLNAQLRDCKLEELLDGNSTS